jgi:hypothetical protein
METKLPLSKQFLANHFCNPGFRSEWLEIERQYHDADMWAYHQIRGLMATPRHLRQVWQGNY